jgi:hypothetical protein
MVIKFLEGKASCFTFSLLLSDVSICDNRTLDNCFKTGCSCVAREKKKQIKRFSHRKQGDGLDKVPSGLLVLG